MSAVKCSEKFLSVSCKEKRTPGISCMTSKSNTTTRIGYLNPYPCRRLSVCLSSVCLSLFLSVSLPLSLSVSVFLSLCFSFSLHVSLCLSFSACLCLSLCLSVCLYFSASVCLSVSLSALSPSLCVPVSLVCRALFPPPPC